jgi:cell division protein FtsL
MPIGAALEVGKAVLSWLWSHKTLAALILVAVALAWSRHQVSTLTVQRDAAQSQIAAAQHEEAIWKASYEGAASALKDLRAKTDAADARARRQQEVADRAVSDLLAAKTEAEAKAEAYRSDLERKANEPGSTAASVGRAAIAGLR